MSKLKYIKDFEILFPKGARVLSQQFRKMLSSTTEGEIVNLIQRNPILDMLNPKLYFGTQYRAIGLDAVSGAYYLNKSYQKQAEKVGFDIKEFKESYHDGVEFEPLLLENFTTLNNSLMLNKLSMRFNFACAKALVATDFNGVYVEGFPQIDYSGGRLTRNASYIHSAKVVEFCPTNPGRPFGSPGMDSARLLAHEFGHAYDFLINKKQSSYLIQDELMGLNGDNLLEALRFSARVLNEDFVQAYNIKEMVATSGSFNPRASAASEFTSFYAELVFETLALSSSLEVFKLRFSDKIKSRFLESKTEGISWSAQKLTASKIIDVSSKVVVDIVGKEFGEDLSNELQKPITEEKIKALNEISEIIKDKSIKAAEDGLADLESLIQDKMESISNLTKKAVELGAKAEDLSSLEELGAELDDFRGQVKEYSKTVEALKTQDFSKTTLNELNQKITNFSEELSKLSTSVDTNVVDLDISQEVREGIKTEIDAVNRVSTECVEQTQEVKESFEKIKEYEEFLPEE